MKKLIFLFSIMFAALMVTAQTKTATVSIPDGGTYKLAEFGTTADTILKTGTYSVTFKLKQPSKAAYDVRVALNKVSGTGAGKIIMYKRVFSDQTWTAIGDTITYGDFTGDTVYYKQQATAQQMNELKVVVDPTDGTTQKIRLDEIELKLWK